MESISSRLDNYLPNELLDMYCQIIKLQWPKQLEDIKPPEWDSMNILFKTILSNELWINLNKRVPEKDFYREMTKGEMDDLEFELWWGSTSQNIEYN